MEKRYPFVVVDGSSYLFRAYHALPKLTSSKGEPTGALRGVLTMLDKIVETYQPEYVAVVLDASGTTFRNRIYPEYKANRDPMPDDLREQIEPLKELIRAKGLPVLIVPDVEADDVIGTLAAVAARDGLATLISTGDKDLAQLVEDSVTLVDTMPRQGMAKDRFLDREGVIAKFGVPPELMVDYLSLVGDSVDNIPGVDKCGPKTAVKWLQEYGSLDGVIAHAEEIKGKVGENLRAAIDKLPMSRSLTTIKRDVELGCSPRDLRPEPPDTATLRAWYRRFEMRKMLEALGEDLDAEDGETPPPLGRAAEYALVLTEAELESWLAELSKADLITFDTETTSIDYMRAELVGVSFASEPGKAAYVPVAHRYPGAPEQLDRDRVLAALRPLLEDANVPKLGQNLKYDLSVLARYGIEIAGSLDDSMLESYVLDSTSRHDMDALAKKYLRHDTIKFEEIAGKGAKQLTFDQVPLDQASPYAAEDADVTLRLHRRFERRLAANPKQSALYRDIEIPLIPVLSRMERRGVRIDPEVLATQSKDLAVRMHELEEKAYEVAGHRFNIGSPKQIGEIFFKELELPVVSKTSTGAPSTSEAVLEQLAEEGHELPRIILDHRGLAKLKSTYTDKLPEMINRETGRVHTSYHQAVAATGRLSSSDPNLQNIPIRTEDGRRIRTAFVARPGYRILAADYSQIELRIMAHLSGDERLVAAFAEGLDIHRVTAAEVWETTPEAVTNDQRRSAKAINFGLIYGMSAFGLARQLGIERRAAREYVERYFERYPGVKAFMDEIRERARRDRYVETLYGRRLYLTDIDHSNWNRRSAAERTAINAPMQGTAADIIKRAMIGVDRWIEDERPPVQMIMQVHDELVFEIAEGQTDATGETVRGIMETAAELDVPLVVEVGVGNNWEEAH